MIEQELKDACCQVSSDIKHGTGWLISPDHVLTALHNIQDASGIPAGRATVKFGSGDPTEQSEAAVVAFDVELDACLLQLPAASRRRSVPLASSAPRPGARWLAFGYPVVKLELGHVVQGTIQQVFPMPIHGIDLDLTVDAPTVLTRYDGLSGAPLMVDGACQGIIRVSVDNTLGAVGSGRLREFLATHGLIFPESQPDIDIAATGSRPQFDEIFVENLRDGESGYVLLDGAHGIGKSTYCRNFEPEADDIEVLGMYALTDRVRGSTPAHQAQPEIFYDWLNSLHSTKSTGRPARLAALSYPQLIEQTAKALEALAIECIESGKRGVLFIDGVNEADKVGGETLQRFVGLLPHVLHAGLKVVITGVGLGALSAKLGDVARGAKRLTLPALGMQAQVDICRSTLQGDLATPELIDLLCDRALGHPLYLRYLIDLVNGGASAEDVEKLPAFSGAIEDFYETIWAQLIVDNDVVNLLAIIARLRWGVATKALMPLLSDSERAVYVPTLARIRHLLTSADQTEIYHPSFSEFVVHKTSTSGDWIQGRLAAFCANAASGDYGTLNRVYHGLLGNLNDRAAAVKACNQSWVDQSVLLGAEPDVLLSDIEDALAAATGEGTAVDIVRLLLLSQRLTFRYDTLFAQSAELVSQALISLGKTDQAMRHILRYRTLIVDPLEAFAVARSLIAAKQYRDALKILDTVERTLISALAEGEMRWNQFAFLMKLRVHLYVLAEEAGADPPTMELVKHVAEVVTDPRHDLPAEKRQELMQAVIGDMLGAMLCLTGSYKPIAQIPLPEGVPSSAQATSLIAILMHAKAYSKTYDIALLKAPITLLLSDIDEKLDDSLPATDRYFSVVDALIEVGAAPVLVEKYAGEMTLAAADVPLFAKSRALADGRAFNDAYRRQRAAYFLSKQLVQPVAQLPRQENWEAWLRTLVRSVAWHDGRARHAHALKDAAALVAVQKDLETNVLPVFAFKLKARIGWEESYFMPEHIVPWLYQHLARLYIDCFNGRAEALLGVLSKGFGDQLGLYNEGFRRALMGVIEPFTVTAGLEAMADMVFDLLIAWRDYTLNNVENRYELVPELLQIVPLLVRAGAPEEALETYRSVLAVSMGPGWYKEDQLSLMSETLSSLPSGTVVDPAALAQIAAYLERATGEMTFQRYVRADKGNFIGELCRRGFGIDAVRYFQHQACGTNQQLFEQVSQGDLDRVSPFVGMRFPGGALEEQASLLQFIKYQNDLGAWKLCWALLETYQQGDDRYLEDWGQAYAEIINGLVDRPSELAWACARVSTISDAMNRERAWLLLQALASSLAPAVLEAQRALVDKVKEVEKSLPAGQLDRIGSNYGLQMRPPDGPRKEAEEPLADTASASSTAVEPDAESNVADEDDSVFLPGTFGRSSAVEEATRAISESHAHLKRRNSAAAIQCSLDALKALQRGRWSIWSHSHSAAEADLILKDLIPDGNALARTYGPLAVEERHVQRWQIASRIIQLTSAVTDTESQAEMLRVSIDHVGQMVGNASSVPFAYIGNGTTEVDTPPALELLLWTLDHPSWERRDTAASMLLWLLRTEDAWIRPILRLMVSADYRYRADVAAAVLDILSNQDPLGLWSRIAPHLDVEALPDQLGHVGRFSVLLRIADRAGGHGVASADKFARALKVRLKGVPAPPLIHASLDLPYYVPASLVGIWYELWELGVLNAASVERFGVALSTACLPLSVEDCHSMESALSRGLGDQVNILDRWDCKVWYALCVAIFPNISLEALWEVDAILRRYNPEPLVEPPANLRPTSRLIDALIAGSEQAYQPSDDEFVYLHMQCLVELGKERVHVELVPQLIPPGSRRPIKIPGPTFRSTEVPVAPDGDTLDVCARVGPVTATFGSLTPAIATPKFLALIGSNASACVRHHWVDASTASHSINIRGYEHALLAVRRTALNLPSGWQLVWSLRIDGKHQVTLNRY